MLKTRGITTIFIGFTFILSISVVNAVDPVTVTGTGATFPQPLIEAWADAFSTATNELVSVTYGGGGSGNGITQITAKSVLFGGSDAPLQTDERTAITNDGDVILHIPETMGAVTPIVNFPSSKLTGRFNLTASLIAKIFQGEITAWNDVAITTINPGLSSSENIVVVHRSDKSGTTFAFTDYLNRATSDWVLGASKQPDWPANTLGGEGNFGVAQKVGDTLYSIGYVELGYASSNGLTTTNVQNKAGNFVSPSNEGVASAAASVVLPKGDESWADVSIADQSGPDAWPISTMTYILVYQDMTGGGAEAVALVAFLTWLMTDEAQNMGPDLGYAPLANATIANNLATIKTIKLTSDVSVDDYTPGKITTTKSSPGFEFFSVTGMFLFSVLVVIKKRK